MIRLRPYSASDVAFARDHLHGPHAGPLEGRLRSAQWRGGAWHDQLLYACLRGDR